MIFVMFIAQIQMGSLWKLDEVGGSPLAQRAQRGGLFLDQSTVAASEIHRSVDDVPIKASILVGNFSACHVRNHTGGLAEATTCYKTLVGCG